MSAEHTRLEPDHDSSKQDEHVDATPARDDVGGASNGEYDRIWSGIDSAKPGAGDWWRDQNRDEPTNPDQADDAGSGLFDGLFSVRAADGKEPIKPANNPIDAKNPGNASNVGNAPKRADSKVPAAKKSVDPKTSSVNKKPVDDKKPLVAVTPAPTYSTGDDYIDHGAACDSGTSESCFLSGPQRLRLINNFQDRTLAAEANHKIALTQLRFDKLITKDEELPWLALLTLDVIGLAFSHALTTAFKSIASEGQAAIATFLDGERSEQMKKLAMRATEQIAKLKEGQLPNQAKALVDLQKKSIAKQTSNVDVMKNKRTAQVSYIDRLTSQSSMMFQHLREKSPAGATDAELIVMRNSLDGPLHTVGVYKAELESKLERFHKSGVKGVGSEAINPYMTQDHVPQDPKGGGSGATFRDRFVVRLQFKSGMGSRHAYASKFWRRDHQADPIQQFNLGRKEIEAPQREGYDHGHKMEYYTKLYRLERLVDPEFEDVAIERHAEQWNAPPRTIIIDDVEARPPQGPQQHPPQPHNPWLRREQPAPPRNPYLRDKPLGEYEVAPSQKVNWEDPTTWEAGQQ